MGGRDGKGTGAPGGEVFSPTEQVYLSMIFSLPALFAWLRWLGAPFATLTARDVAIAAAALAGLLAAAGWAKGMAGVRAAAEEGLIVSAVWVLVAIIAARHPLYEAAAESAAAAYAAGSLFLFGLMWHILPLGELARRRRASLARLWLVSVGVLDGSALAASSAVVLLAPGGAVRALGLAGAAASGIGLLVVTGALLGGERMAARLWTAGGTGGAGGAGPEGAPPEGPEAGPPGGASAP